jgi:hypothetical protein
VDFQPRIVQQRGEFVSGQLLAARPVVVPPHGVVQTPVVGHRRVLDVDDRKTLPGRRDDPFRVGEHLQVGGLHLHAVESS